MPGSPRTDVGGRAGSPLRLGSMRALVLVFWLLSPATVVGGEAPGLRPIGAGSVPVSHIHASAWFVQAADQSTKRLTLVVFLEGTPGWHTKTTDFRWNTGDTMATINMNVGQTPIQVAYRSDTRGVRILDRAITLASDNVYLVSGIDGPAPVVKGMGIHDLAFEPKDNPAVALLARNALVRNALIGESPEGAAKGPPRAPADLTALDRQGIELLRKGGAENDRAACELFRKAAARGYAPAQYRLGYCYEAGRGVDQDLLAAHQWFRKAADQDQVDAQYKLAYCFRVGLGVVADSTVALSWYIRAGENGDAEAQSVLGYMHATGQGVRVDPARALAWFLKAAENGMPAAQLEVARRYRDGDGIAQDLTSAYQWLVILLADPDVSAAKNRGPADEFIRSVESRLDEGSRARAVATAHQFCRAYARRYIEKLGR